MSEARELTGLPLFQAVVRVRYPQASSIEMENGSWRICRQPKAYWAPIILARPSELEAWHDAARREIEAAYVINKGDYTGLFFVVPLTPVAEMFPYYDTRDLAEQAAMPHIVREHAALAETPTKPTMEQVAAQMAEAPTDIFETASRGYGLTQADLDETHSLEYIQNVARRFYLMGHHNGTKELTND